MYKLTDFSIDELRHLSSMMDISIEETQKSIERVSRFDPSTTKDHMIQRQNRKLEMCREMNVRFITSLQIVKDRETTHAN